MFQQEEELQLLSMAMDRLPEDKRELLLLARYEGFSAEEIAELLGIDAGAVKVRVHRAMKQLRELILDSSSEETKWTAKKPKTILRTI